MLLLQQARPVLGKHKAWAHTLTHFRQFQREHSSSRDGRLRGPTLNGARQLLLLLLLLMLMLMGSSGGRAPPWRWALLCPR